MSEILADLLSLYEPEGEARLLIQEAERSLVSASGSHDPHEIGRLRGQIDGLRKLRTRLEAKAQAERKPPETKRPERTLPRRIH